MELKKTNKQEKQHMKLGAKSGGGAWERSLKGWIGVDLIRTDYMHVWNFLIIKMQIYAVKNGVILELFPFL